MKKFYLVLTIFIIGLSGTNAQQIPLNYEYLINPYSLNPAYAGLHKGFEAYLDYKKDRMDFEWSPQTIGFDFNTPLSDRVGMGARIVYDKASIFTNTSAQLSYAYHAKFSDNHWLSLSLNGGIDAKNIDVSDLNLQNPFDPVINGQQELKQTSLNFGASMLYRLYGLKLGFVAPALITSNSDFFDMTKHYIIHGSYNFNLSANWQLEPLAMVRGGENIPWNFEGTAIVKYLERYYLALTYRKNNIGAVSVGGFLTDNLVMHYAYDFALPFDDYRGAIGNNRGGHEIAIGYRVFGQKPSKKDQILNELKEKSTIKQVDSLHTMTKDLENKLKLLNDSISDLKKKQQDNVRKALDDSKLNQQTTNINNNTIKTQQEVEILNKKIDSLEMSLSDYNKKMASKFRVLSTRESVRDDHKPVDAGYYVVIGSFRYQQNAKKAVELYKDVNPFIIHNTARGWYYVYSDRYDKLEPAIERMKKLRAEPGRFDDAWVHIYRNY